VSVRVRDRDRVRVRVNANPNPDPNQVWGGFLAGWPGLPGNENHATYAARLRFGISIFLKFPAKVATTFVAYLATFTARYGPLVPQQTSNAKATMPLNYGPHP
jgi:hypothetical protein